MRHQVCALIKVPEHSTPRWVPTSEDWIRGVRKRLARRRRMGDLPKVIEILAIARAKR